MSLNWIAFEICLSNTYKCNSSANVSICQFEGQRDKMQVLTETLVLIFFSKVIVGKIGCSHYNCILSEVGAGCFLNQSKIHLKDEALPGR